MLSPSALAIAIRDRRSICSPYQRCLPAAEEVPPRRAGTAALKRSGRRASYAGALTRLEAESDQLKVENLHLLEQFVRWAYKVLTTAFSTSPCRWSIASARSSQQPQATRRRNEPHILPVPDRPHLAVLRSLSVRNRLGSFPARYSHLTLFATVSPAICSTFGGQARELKAVRVRRMPSSMIIGSSVMALRIKARN